MSSLNKIIIIGNINSTLELKATQEGDSVINFVVDVKRPERQDGIDSLTDRIKVVAWREKAEYVAKLSRGDQVLVEGNIHTRNYDNDEGIKIYVTEIEARDVRNIGSASSSADDLNQETLSSSIEKISPIIETKEISNDAPFDFSDDSKELNDPPEFVKETEEDIPF
jgi:single-strand DNA-binding protein